MATTLALLLGPVVIAALYVFVLGTPMYLSETRFAVRGGEHNRMPGLSGILGGSGGGTPPLIAGLVDGYSVRDFLQSREAMEKLDAAVGFVSRYSIPEADQFVRLPSDASRDRAYQTYKSMIQPSFNMVEQIVVVRVYAFSPEDAVMLASALTTLAEKFSDDINKRSRQDALTLSEQEAERYDSRVRNARIALNDWRKRNANIDPGANVLMINTLITTLEQNLSDTRSQLAQTMAATQNSPQKKGLEQRIAAIKAELADARRRLTGDSTLNDRSEALQLAEFERLKIDLESAEKSREGARASLDDARVQVIRQQKYVFTVAAPSQPDSPDYPGPYKFLGGGLLAGCLLLIGVSIGTGLLRESLA